VEFAGTVPDIWPHLARADVFALASRTEAFGIAVVEAMAAGLPVVAAAVGGVPELVSPGVTGELFPPGDHRALAAHLLRLLREPELRGRMGAAAQQAAEGYRLKETVRKYCALYADLLRRPEMAQP
jgi:glycosyltransferase involved in cell wall biosynthesis